MDPTSGMLRLAGKARMAAVAAGFYKGRADEEGMGAVMRCRSIFRHHGGDLGAVVLFTRDIWYHNCGWWKNPDYERCEHLSLSFFDWRTRESAPHDHKRAAAWCTAFWDHYKRLLWVEPPTYEHGKAHDVHHYRLFMHEDWKTPLLPRGEVYTREFTEAGWKSFSELHGEEPR
jgi:hypothetical protein